MKGGTRPTSDSQSPHRLLYVVLCSVPRHDLLPVGVLKFLRQAVDELPGPRIKRGPQQGLNELGIRQPVPYAQKELCVPVLRLPSNDAREQHLRRRIAICLHGALASERLKLLLAYRS